ncbi:MAG: hypothetical protein O7G86_12320, partial [Gammaproteobacteria bacterium]|nr:hypothetical protein [Gammaproteobacteria bacterium]
MDAGAEFSQALRTDPWGSSRSLSKARAATSSVLTRRGRRLTGSHHNEMDSALIDHEVFSDRV